MQAEPGLSEVQNTNFSGNIANSQQMGPPEFKNPPYKNKKHQVKGSLSNGRGALPVTYVIED